MTEVRLEGLDFWVHLVVQEIAYQEVLAIWVLLEVLVIAVLLVVLVIVVLVLLEGLVIEVHLGVQVTLVLDP